MTTRDEYVEVMDRLDEIRRLTCEILDLTSNDPIFGEKTNEERASLKYILKSAREVHGGFLQQAFEQDLLVWPGQ